VCEVCRDPRLDAEQQQRLSHDEGDTDPWLCEYPVRRPPGLCGLPATWAVRFNYVEEHLCDAHRAEEATEREPGLLKLLQSTGLETGGAVLAIKERARCENSPPLGALRRCEKPARWAVVVAAESHYCDDHLRQEREEPERVRRHRTASGKALPRPKGAP
jgi:hypothetical protein